MEYLKHLILFVLATCVAYGHLEDKRNKVLTLLILALPTVAVLHLGPWGLVTYVAGYGSGLAWFLAVLTRNKRIRKGPQAGRKMQ